MKPEKITINTFQDWEAIEIRRYMNLDKEF